MGPDNLVRTTGCLFVIGGGHMWDGPGRTASNPHHLAGNARNDDSCAMGPILGVLG